MFAKVLRIVAKWYGNPKSEGVFAQIFEDAVYAWKTGEFEGAGVFQAEDPGGTVEIFGATPSSLEEDTGRDSDPKASQLDDRGELGVAAAEMRIDLSRIGGT
ncbi:hypothetical protein GGE07_006117 [Sinorhizobium terangae]|nr:hypothetical protein [Sinorhizobium terangae]